MRLRSVVGAVALGVAAAWLWDVARPAAGPGPAVESGRNVRHGRVRVFNRALLNPVMLAVAGRGGGTYPAVIRHTGRRSGRPYATPVVAVPVAGGFVVPLPYGPDTDWCLNVRAAGWCRVERAGRAVRVVRPELLTEAEVAPQIDERHRRLWHRFGIRDYVLLRDEAATDPEPRPGGGR